MTAARPQIRTEQHGRAPALTTAVLSLCSRSPSPPTAGNSARTRCTISPASIAGPAPSAAGKGSSVLLAGLSRCPGTTERPHRTAGHIGGIGYLADQMVPARSLRRRLARHPRFSYR